MGARVVCVMRKAVAVRNKRQIVCAIAVNRRRAGADTQNGCVGAVNAVIVLVGGDCRVWSPPDKLEGGGHAGYS